MVALLKSLHLLLVVACTVNSAPGHGEHPYQPKCGTPDPSDEDLKKLQHRMRKYKTRRKSRAVRAPLCVGCIKIEVAFHVVTDIEKKSLTSVFATDENIAQQIQIVNQHFEETPFYFVHKVTTRTVNNTWVYGRVLTPGPSGSGRTTELTATITAALRVGGPDVVNLIFVDTDGAYGCIYSFATFPRELGMFPPEMYSKKDTIFICSVSISPDAGGLYEGTVTHEIGHWLGLQHTFLGNSCDESNLNDFVEDTPQQSGPSNFLHEYCDSGRDSCPELPGDDPVHNFMDYSMCKTEFTLGQIERMYDQFNTYRRRVEPCGEDEIDVHVEAQFYRNPPESTFVAYIDWGLENPSKTILTSFEPHINFKDQELTRDLCLPRNTMYEFVITDSEFDESPGSYSVSMNGRELAQGSTLNEAGISIFLAGDSALCSPGESRFEMEILFDGNPNDISWDIHRASDNTLVVDQTATQGFKSGIYGESFARRKLYFDQCLPGGNYVFAIHDANPSPTVASSHYTLSRDGTEFHVGGENGGMPTELVTISVPIRTILECFSGSSTVQVHKKGPVALSSVQIGDLVHVGNGKYEPIYSFGHYDPTSRSTFFLQLQMNNEKSLVLSRHHLIFAADARFAIPASLVKVGDELLDAFGAKLSVVSIRAVVARGLYAPFTPSGKIVVDGVMASSFVALGGGGNDTNVHSMAGVIELSHHWLAHSFEFPHRVACYYLARCPNEIYNGEGISVWVATPHKHGLWLLEQNLAVRSILLFLLAAMFLMFNVIEYVWLHPTLTILAVCITFHYLLLRMFCATSTKQRVHDDV